MKKTPFHITQAAQLASLLEVSGYPKPGNVHRTRDFSDMRYEHFLAGSIAMGKPIQETAKKGIEVGEEKINTAEIGLGEKIKQGVEAVKASHQGGNTHLGTILLFIPLAAASGKELAENKDINPKSLRENFDLIMKSSTAKDSLKTYEAIQKSIDLQEEKERKETNHGKWLGNVDETELSITNPKTKEILGEEDISLYEWMKASADWDGIGRELTSSMEASFEVGFPTLRKTCKKEDINTGVVHTFLKILSKYPDTFIARKVGLEKTSNINEAVKIGMEKAEEISNRAESILNSGGLTTEEGRKKLMDLDRELQKSEGKLNPGTTADFTAASINIALLNGLKY